MIILQVLNNVISISCSGLKVGKGAYAITRSQGQILGFQSFHGYYQHRVVKLHSFRMFFSAFLKSTIPQLIKQEKSGQAMKQTPFNTEFNIPCQPFELYQNTNGDFCAFPQNYLQNFAFYSQNQLLPYSYSAPFGQFFQQFAPSPNFSANLYHSGTLQLSPIQELKPSSVPHPCSYPTNVEQEAESLNQSISSEVQKRIQRRQSRMRHLNEINKKRALKKVKRNLTSYYWNPEENKRYLQFLSSHPGIFELPVSEKKNIRVNVLMSKKVKTRSPPQCHSHHQKMVKKYGSVSNIIQMMENQTGQNLERSRVERDQVKDQVKVEHHFVDL